MSQGPVIECVRQGLENEPVLVIDGFATAPEDLIEDASFLAFSEHGAQYPGLGDASARALSRGDRRNL